MRTVYVAVYESEAPGCNYVVAVSTDYAKLEVAIESWKAENEDLFNEIGDFNPDYVSITTDDLIE